MDTFHLPTDRRKAVALISKPAKPELSKILPELMAWLNKHNYEVVVDRETTAYIKAPVVVPRSDLADRPLDLAIVLGGDGTLLSAARAVAKSEVPVLGVNLGSLGFLTEVPVADLYPTLEAMERGACALDSRSMVNCELHRAGTSVAHYQALNDVVVSKSAISRLNNFDLFIDKSFVSNYKADGLIVSTPTGSTAYSLAAAGPILMPNVSAFVVTPVSPHSLTHRALVVRDTAEIEIVVRTGDEEAYLSVDGQVGMPIHDGDRVGCQKAAHGVHLIRRSNTFFDVLRTKLKWGQR